MNALSAHQLTTGTNDQVFDLLGKALATRLPTRDSPTFLEELRQLPIGLRAMAATYELSVSLAMDDFGWHFGNWHSTELADETAAGLLELEAPELADLFQKSYLLARQYWNELGAENWMDWYHDSPLEEAVMPLNRRAWQLLEDKWNGIFSYWVEYARQYPERLGAQHDA